MIEIFNLRSVRPKHPWEFKVDRSSPVGNPFNMYQESERYEVCDKYRKWFYEATHDEAFYAYMQKMKLVYEKYGKLRLFCWCSPKKCHAETIKEYLENDKI